MLRITRSQHGATLIEVIVFLVVVSIALVALIRVYTQAVTNSVDPALRTRALELAHAQLDVILSRKFDENTPTGGIPHCNSSGLVCAGIGTDIDYDDVGDFNGFTDTSHPNHSVSVSVVEAGTELDAAMNNADARRITVTVTIPGGDSVQLSAYKVNF